MKTQAILMERPKALKFSALSLVDPKDGDVVVSVRQSGISTGTERLLWSGRMPPFPGMGYPLVPGYETVGEVIETTEGAGIDVGTQVFVPGANCFTEARGLFGGAASQLVVPAKRLHEVPQGIGEEAVLLALAATARHALTGAERLPEVVVGHGVLGRLIARIATAMGAAPLVWETNETRHGDARGYCVVKPEDDDRQDYAAIMDVSGDAQILDTLIGRLAPGGEIALAGFYAERLGFDFPAAFMREARMRIAAEWKPDDMAAVLRMVADGRLALDGLITHRATPENAEAAYRTAFEDPACLKMIFDWRSLS
ncbi:MAG: chlorophyll synthesis pathway protein BchC [Pseudomonadota bacterium]